MTPFELARAEDLAGGRRPARRRRSDRAADRRRHRADADDEGRRVPADEARQLCASSSDQLTRIAVGADGELTVGAMTPLAVLERSDEVAQARAGHHRDAAHAVQHPRAQCRDRRRRARACRSAHGPAAGADRARRRGGGVGPRGQDQRAHHSGRRSLRRLFRDRAGEGRADLRADVPGARQDRRAAYLKVTTARPTTGRRSASRSRSIRRRHDGQGRAIVVSAATEKPTRLTSAEQVLERRDRRRQDACARAGDAAAEEAECITDGQRLGRLQEGARARLCRARGAQALHALRSARMERPTDGDANDRVGKRGRSGARCRGSKRASKVTGRADYVHNMRLPGMLHGKIFRSTVAHGRIKSLDVARGEEGARRLSRRHLDDVKTVIPNPYLRPGVPRPADPRRSTRCTMSASRSRWCSPPIRISRRKRRR